MGVGVVAGSSVVASTYLNATEKQQPFGTVIMAVLVRLPMSVSAAVGVKIALDVGRSSPFTDNDKAIGVTAPPSGINTLALAVI